MANTFLDELVEYPVKALHCIGTDPTVVKLLTDNPDIDMESEDADEVFEKFLFDYIYVTERQLRQLPMCVSKQRPQSLQLPQCRI